MMAMGKRVKGKAKVVRHGPPPKKVARKQDAKVPRGQIMGTGPMGQFGGAAGY